MWVFLNNAFLSIVEDKEDWHDLWVRARFRGDIERVFPDAEVAETPAADYRFRAKLTRGTLERAMMLAVRGINYTNFKKSVPDKRRHDAYLKVWGHMAHEQEMQLIEDNVKEPFCTEQRSPSGGVVRTDPANPAILCQSELFIPKRVKRRGKKAAARKGR